MRRPALKVLIIVLVIVAVLVLIGLATVLKIVKQHERGVLFRLGQVQGQRNPGLRVIISFIDVLHRVSLRIVTKPIQSQGIITRGNVSVHVTPRLCSCVTCRAWSRSASRTTPPSRSPTPHDHHRRARLLPCPRESGRRPPHLAGPDRRPPALIPAANGTPANGSASAGPS
jgi:hypothetical protein